MKAALLGVLAGVGLVVALVVVWPDANRLHATTPSVAGNSAELVTLSTALGDQRQQLTIIDPRLRVMSVYHVDSTTGEISLKSVRNFHWDLQMSEFNAASPLPHEIRSLLEQR